MPANPANTPYLNNAPFVSFIGRFKDLIPNGWTFQKLFANNYRQYHKTYDGKPYSQGCRIWQAHGGYLEIDDLSDDSVLFVSKMQQGKLSEIQGHYRNGEVNYSGYIDMQQKAIHPFNSPEHQNLVLTSHKLVTNDDFDTFFGRYREYSLKPKLIDMIQDLLDKGWISVHS